MADNIFGKHLAKSLAAWDARINDRIATHENKVFRHCLRDLQLSSNRDHFKPRAAKHEVPEDNGEDEVEETDTVETVLWTSCDRIWQLISTRGEDFCLNYIVKVSKNLMQCLVSSDINLSVGTAKLFWLVSSLDAGIQQLWRNMDIVGFIASALKQLAKIYPRTSTVSASMSFCTANLTIMIRILKDGMICQRVPPVANSYSHCGIRSP